MFFIEDEYFRLQEIIYRVALAWHSILFELSRKAVAELLNILEAADYDEGGDTISLKIAVKLQRKGVEAKLVISGERNVRQPDPNLCRLIGQARYWFNLLASGKAASVQEIALREGVFVTEISRIIPLAFLVPVIVEGR